MYIIVSWKRMMSFFDPAPAHKFQARWMIYGVYLPDEVLEKIYNKNAIKILNRYKEEIK